MWFTGRDQNVNINRNLEEGEINDHGSMLEPFEGFNSSVQEVIADVVGKARELELEMEPEDVTGLI